MMVEKFGGAIAPALTASIRLYGVCIALMLSVFTMSAALAGGVPSAEDDGTVSPAEAAKMIASPASAAAGEGLFNQVCTYCHGAKGVGGRGRKMQCRHYDASYLYNTISNGKRSGSLVMPAWKQSYSERTRWELVSYIMTLKNLDSCQ